MKRSANPDQRPAVIVVGLDCVTGLQAARVFARHGVPVMGIASDPKNFCCRTRVCSRILTADTNGQELIDCLVELGPSFSQKPVLVPCTDNSVLQIAKHQERLGEWFHITHSGFEIVDALTDKVRFSQFAEENKLPVPRSFSLSSFMDAEAVASSVTYPAALKPSVKTLRWQQNVREKAIVIHSAEDLPTVFKKYAAWSETFLLQEWIPGPLENNYTCDAYFDEKSQPLVTFTSHKLRQWPSDTGVGSLSEECDSPDVRREMIRLFQAAGFRGLAYVEMKRHEETGKYLIIEPNIGRPTGRSTCAEALGVELLYTMYCDRVGLPLPSCRHQQFIGGKWIYWKRDLCAAWYEWRRGNLTLSGWCQSLRGQKTCAVFSWRDPLPFLADWLRGGKQLVSRATSVPTK